MSRFACNVSTRTIVYTYTSLNWLTWKNIENLNTQLQETNDEVIRIDNEQNSAFMLNIKYQIIVEKLLACWLNSAILASFQK